MERQLTSKEHNMLKCLEKHEYYFDRIHENGNVTVRNAYTMQSNPFKPYFLIDCFNYYYNNKNDQK